MESLGNCIPNKPSPSRHKEPYLDTRQNFRHIISDFTAVSHLTMELAAAAPSEPPSVTELPSVGGGVQYQLYSCTVYSVQSPPCAAVCSRPTALRSSVGNPGPQRKSPFILGLVLHRHHPPASLLHYHIIWPLVAALDPPHHNHNRRDPTNG